MNISARHDGPESAVFMFELTSLNTSKCPNLEEKSRSNISEEKNLLKFGPSSLGSEYVPAMITILGGKYLCPFPPATKIKNLMQGIPKNCQ